MKKTEEHLIEMIPTLPDAAQEEIYSFLEYMIWKYRPVDLSNKEVELSVERKVETGQEVVTHSREVTSSVPEMEVVQDSKNFTQKEELVDKKSNPWSDLKSKLFN